MNDLGADTGSVDARLGELFESVNDFTDRGCYASACRVYGEIRRLARAERRVVPYLIATFHLADKSPNVLQPAQCRDLSIELISLVESEEQARKFEPRLPEAEYAYTAGWMTTCVYDKLADATAMVEGYNSPGMHESLQAGIQVCRRAGKLECIKCFREYAADVYRAADDLDMALHNVRIVASGQGPETVRGDRRWLGTYKEARLTLLTGRLDEAESACRRALELTGTYHTLLTARLLSSLDLEVIELMAGRNRRSDPEGRSHRSCAIFPEIEPPPVGEFPDLDLEYALRDALQAGCRGVPMQALEILAPWDRLLRERRYVDRWLEVRLRMIAAAMLADDTLKAESLSKGLESRAQEAQDWLTLKRLKNLRERPFPVSPLALPYPLTAGPFAGTSRTVAMPVDVPAEPSPGSGPSETDRVEPREVPTESLPQWIEELKSKCGQLSDSEVQGLIRRGLRLDPDNWRSFAWAGEYFLQANELAEAERCFARAFRLQRSHPLLALRLSGVYAQTDRPRDALEVLDLCLRQGTFEPPVLFEAAMLAQRLDRPQAMVTYLEKYEQVQPGEAWIPHYLAVGLLDSCRPAEAGAALDEEAARNPRQTLHVTILRACVAAQLEDPPRLELHAAEAIETRLAGVDSLTLEGLAQHFRRLWRALFAAGLNDLQTRLERLLLAAGLMPDEAFEPHRTRNEPVEGLRYFVCHIRQPLDADWRNSPGCLHGQDHWTRYVANWGVLAPDADAAAEMALNWQSRCYGLPAEIMDVQVQPGEFSDSPGIIWQGPHFPEAEKP